MRVSILLTAAISSLAPIVSAQCSRDLLKTVTSLYTEAQAAGDPSVLGFLLSTELKYTENEVEVDYVKGVISQPLKIDNQFNSHDPVLCGTFTELIVADDPHPYVIGTRILVTNNKITTIESVVTDDGDWLFNATGYLHYTSQEKWGPIPPEKRDSRDVIKAAGDAYFDRFHNASVVIPAGTPCARLEGGASTGASNPTANTCTLGVPSTITVTNRRYVVDEEYGTVDIFCGFPQLDRSVPQKAMPDSHLFRVEGGLIRYIHTVSSCEAKGCGLSGGFPGSGGPPPRQRRRRHRESVFRG